MYGDPKAILYQESVKIEVFENGFYGGILRPSQCVMMSQ